MNEVLVTAGPKAHVAFDYQYSNFSFVEGDEGIVVIDTGWFPDASASALAPLLGFLAGHKRPTDGLGVCEDAGLHGFVF